MKSKLIMLFLVHFFLICSLVTAACGGSSPNTKAPAASGPAARISPSASAAAVQNKPSGKGINWDDMPVYSGASETQKGNWSIPASQDADYTRFEWRFYQTGASPTDVAAFYKSKMPASGWTDVSWIEMQGTSWGMYNKNNENDAAMVWVSPQDNKVTISMWRGTK
jgi:hypothetical protein